MLFVVVHADLFECHWADAAVLTDNVVLMYSHLLLDEAQKVLLIHTRRSVDVSVNLTSHTTRQPHLQLS